jgi:hypothetical protein
MTSSTAPPRSADFSGRALATLAALAAALGAAFVVAPATLAASGPGGGFADQRHLTEALRTAFVEYWRSGDRELSPALAGVVDYWLRYHVAKAVIAAVLLTVLVVLGTRLWTAFLNVAGPAPGRRIALASAGVLVTTLALLSLATVMANVQGAVAPFASLLPMLTGGATGGELADTLAQVRQGLAGSGSAPPALQVMIDDFARYHAAMAVVATAVAAVLVVTGVALWRRSSRTRAFGVLSLSLSLLVIVVAVANTGTAADPGPALLAFFEGGW